MFLRIYLASLEVGESLLNVCSEFLRDVEECGMVVQEIGNNLPRKTLVQINLLDATQDRAAECLKQLLDRNDTMMLLYYYMYKRFIMCSSCKNGFNCVLQALL